MCASEVQQLALQAALRRHIDPIVHAANKDAALLEGARMQKSQLQNVLNVAQESHSLAVVANFIRYQIGRAGVGPDWRHNDFGLSVVAQIEEPDGVIAQQAQKVAAALGERLEALPEDVARAIRYELMRYYLGYLQRAYVYGNSGVAGAWEHLREGRAGCSTP